MMNLKRNDDTPLLEIFIICIVVCTLTVLVLKYMTEAIYEQSYDWITCGEALNRHTGHASPQTKEDEVKWNDCIFNGVKKWEK